QTQALPDALGTQLVHGQCRGQHATAGIGDAGAFQQALHGAILSATAVQDDEGAVDLLAGQPLQQVGADIDAEGVDTGSLQRGQHGGTGLQGNRPLGTGPAVEHGDPTESLGIDVGNQTHVG